MDGERLFEASDLSDICTGKKMAGGELFHELFLW
jgi:hypothetical protein